MNNNFIAYIMSLFPVKRDTHFKHLMNIGGRIYYGGNSRTFKMNQRKELRISRRRRRR